MRRAYAWWAFAGFHAVDGAQPASSTTSCAGSFPADCSQAKCCSDPALQCFKKHDWYAACLATCTPGKNVSNPDSTKWSCERMDKPAPARKELVGNLTAEEVLSMVPEFEEMVAHQTADDLPLSNVLEEAERIGHQQSHNRSSPDKGVKGHQRSHHHAKHAKHAKAAKKSVRGSHADAGPSCPACAPSKRSVPDVVIPFYERDLCKVGYTVKSIGVHDPHGTLGTVILMWVSQQPLSAFQGAIDKVQNSLNGSHKVKVLDLSSQVNRGGAGGWFAQQVFKLKVASLVSSEYYVVLDSKNTLIRDIRPELFFTSCNQGKIFGEFEPDEIPPPHNGWYEASASVLGVPPPREAGGKWPTSITPMIIHTKTVLEMLSSIGEDSSTDELCRGPLCDMLGARSSTGTGATEFTMYVLAARARSDSDCNIAVVKPDSSNPPAVSLWRGEQDAMDINAGSCKAIADKSTSPFMFGSQYGALDNMRGEQRGKVEKDFLHIFTRAKMHNASLTSTDALIECVAGRKEGQAGPLLDLAQAPARDEAGQSEGAFCCTASADDGDFCGGCFEGARAGAGTFCGASKDRCQSCGKARWCEAPDREGEAKSIVMRDEVLRIDSMAASRWRAAAPNMAGLLALALTGSLAARCALTARCRRPRGARPVAREEQGEQSEADMASFL